MAKSWCVCLALFAVVAEPILGGESKLDARAADLAKFEQPEPWVLKERDSRGSPGGTKWDNAYRSMIQTSVQAVEKGFPSHEEAKDRMLKKGFHF